MAPNSFFYQLRFLLSAVVFAFGCFILEDAGLVHDLVLDQYSFNMSFSYPGLYLRGTKIGSPLWHPWKYRRLLKNYFVAYGEALYT